MNITGQLARAIGATQTTLYSYNLIVIHLFFHALNNESIIYDLVLENRPNCHIWYFEKCQFQILKPLWSSCARLQPHQIYCITGTCTVFSQCFITISASQLTMLDFEQLFSVTVISRVACKRDERASGRGQADGREMGRWQEVGGQQWVGRWQGVAKWHRVRRRQGVDKWQCSGRVQAAGGGKTPARTAQTSYESKKCQPQVPTRLVGLRGVSLLLGSISDSFLQCSALHGSYCLSCEFTWSAKLALEKQDSRSSLVMAL